MLRESTSAGSVKSGKSKRVSSASAKTSHTNLSVAGEQRFAALKAWRAEVAREHNLPAYVIFHDTTLLAIAECDPQCLNDLEGISGIGTKKLEAYGEEVQRVVT